MTTKDTKIIKPNTPKKKKGFLSSILTNKKKKTAFMSSIAGLAMISIVFPLSNALGNTTIRDMGVIGAIIVIIIPVTMIDMKTARRKDSIDRNLSIFLLSIGSSVQSGLSLLRAIEDAADRNMGSLTPELRNLRANISWGMPVEEAFENFTNRVGTRMAQRVMVLLQLAMRIGGDVVETIDVIQKHVTEMSNIEKERKSSLQPYVLTIYIAFGVFIAIAGILVSQFFSEITHVQDALRESSRGVSLPQNFQALLNVNVKDLGKIMFHMTLVEAVFGGLAAGKISDGTFVAGIKHIVILIVISVVVFAMLGVL